MITMSFSSDYRLKAAAHTHTHTHTHVYTVLLKALNTRNSHLLSNCVCVLTCKHVSIYIYGCVRLSLPFSCPSPPSDSFSTSQSNQSFGLGVMTSFVLRSNHMERCHLEGADSAQHTHTHKYSRIFSHCRLGSNSSGLSES